jgi:hypothetical protein
MSSDAASNPYMISQPTEWSALKNAIRAICPGRRPACARSNVIPEFRPPTAPKQPLRGIPVNQQRVSPPAPGREVLRKGVHTLCDSNASDRSRHPRAQVLRVLTTLLSESYLKFKNPTQPAKVGSFWSGKDWLDYDEGRRPELRVDEEEFLQGLKTYKKKLEEQIKRLKNVQLHTRHQSHWIPWDETSTEVFFSTPVSSNHTRSEIKKIIAEIEELEEELSKWRNGWENHHEFEKEESEYHSKNIQKWKEYNDDLRKTAEKAPLVQGWEAQWDASAGRYYYWNTVNNQVTWDKPVASETTEHWGTIQAKRVY